MSRSRSRDYGFAAAAACIVAGNVLGYALSYPLQAGLNKIAQTICANNKDRVIVSYKDKIFVGQTKLACVPRKFT